MTARTPPRPGSGFRPDSGSRADSGFSLVEVLLAMAIAATLFTGMFVALDQVVRSRNDMSNQATPYVIGPAILDVLAKDLSNLYWYDFKENNTFYGAKAQLLGRDADALSFLTLSKAIAPETEIESEDGQGRYSFVNEVAYVCRPGPAASGFLQLWRREDFFVDDAPHSDGDYVLLYDKVHSVTIQYIRRDPSSPEGIGGNNTQRTAEQMVESETSWSVPEEGGLPRALLVTLEIFARDSEQEVEDSLASQAGRTYVFRRYIPLPQVHMSLQSEQQIANWDGEYNEATAVTATNPNANQATGGAGAGGRGRRGQGQGGQRGRGQQGNRPRGANPFQEALRGGGRSGGSRGGGGGGLGALFGGGR